MNLVARVILDIVITLMFKVVYHMVCSDDVIAVNEEPRAVTHVLFGKCHEEGEKDDTDKLFHDVTTISHKDTPLVKQVLSIYRQKGNRCKTIFQKNMKKSEKPCANPHQGLEC